MPTAPFGNDPAKLARYRAFWNREDISRPLIGFTLRGWFPLEEYAATRAWQAAKSNDPILPNGAVSRTLFAHPGFAHS